MTSPATSAADWVREQKAAYASAEHRPVGSFAAFMDAYGAAEQRGTE